MSGASRSIGRQRVGAFSERACREKILSTFVARSRNANFGVVKTVVLGNSGFAPCRKQGILTKTAKVTKLHSTHKNKGLVLRALKKTKMTKMAGVAQANPWFTKSGFSQPRERVGFCRVTFACRPF